jgi:hypothetical protein
VLKLREQSTERVRYDAELESANEHRKSLATVRMEDGAVSFDTWEPSEPPAWLVDSTRAILRIEWRAKSWPRRITRWRAAK